MAKTFKYLIIGTVVIVAVAFIAITFTIDSIVKSGIEDIGTEMTGTSVTVENVSISPFSGSGTISGFRVANPEGYNQEYAMEVNDFSIELELMSMFSDRIIVNQLTVEGPAIYVEQKLPENNLREILSNINSVSSGETTDAELFIEHFTMQNGTADLYTEVGGERSAQVEISAIELNNLGSDQEALESVIQQIAEQVAEAALQAAADSGVEQLKDAVRDIFN